LGAIYLIFFLSGAAALMYEVVWVRSMSLVFGGSHLAVTTVLSVFMGGLAAGGYLIGRHVDRIKRPLRLYGQLELGIALSAVLFAGLMKIYPSVYILLARGSDESLLYLSIVRVGFAVVALIVPTTLMGGTLPVLTRFTSRHPEKLGTQLSFLYGFNTLGAVAGTMSAGFFFLRLYSVSTTLQIAILMNVMIGVASIVLDRKASAVFGSTGTVFEGTPIRGKEDLSPPELSREPARIFSLRLVLLGIGVSGFCALGYEVLWTRVLTMVVGASVYGFTAMLAAFLTGIALGSKSYGIFSRILGSGNRLIGRHIFGFGLVQVVIGLTALFVTIHIRHLPTDAMALEGYFRRTGLDPFEVQQWTNLALAFLYMVVPAFFMGLAFPLAGRVQAAYRGMVGRAVGEVLAYNTMGAILGAALSGFVLIYVFGIERSLQILAVVNICFGVLVVLSLQPSRPALRATAGVALAALLLLALSPHRFRVWDTEFFAIFRANQAGAFRTPQMVKEAKENTEVLYFAEGVDAIVSSIKMKGGDQAFITNGRVEASSNLIDQQLQYTLGHLPMLLNRNPRSVLVVGLGSGMTLGATSVHPSVRKIILAELEPAMIGVAKTFTKYNHRVLEDPRLRVLFNDGRNFLLTTREKFDVITADPIHPWFRGAGYLYTREYFELVSKRLAEGGVMCQWLPIYELTPANLKSVVKTFTGVFPYTMLWLTHNDSAIVGSNAPIILDEAELEKRISAPLVREDLGRIMMGSARDFLSYFVMGKPGMEAFGAGGILNTDDNLYLEFAAPLSMGKSFLMGRNAEEIARYRESVLPYLVPAPGGKAQEEQVREWSLIQEATFLYDKAHTLFLRGLYSSSEFLNLLEGIEMRYPWYGPGRFLKREYSVSVSMEPRPLKQVSFAFDDGRGGRRIVEITAVMSRVSAEMTLVDFVDNNARVIYGQLRIPGRSDDDAVMLMTDRVMERLRHVYDGEAETARKQGRRYPAAESVLEKMRDIISKAGIGRGDGKPYEDR
jgi:spermidine synthase